MMRRPRASRRLMTMWSSSTRLAAGLVLAMLAIASPLAAPQGQGRPVAVATAAAPANAPAMAPAQFVGVWDYNADESINIATGKPEQPAGRLTRATAPRTVENS